MTWLANHKTEVALILLALVVVAIVSLVASFWPGTGRPSVPEATQTAATQTAVTTAISQVRTERKTNDEAIKNAYRLAKESVANLSADTVVLELNVLLTELRGGSTQP